MQITYEKLYNDVLPALNAIDMQRKTRLAYAAAKLGKRVEKAAQAFSEARDDLQVEHCLTDEKTGEILLTDKGQRKFSKEGQRALSAAMKAKLVEEVEIVPYFCSDVKALASLPMPVLLDLEGLLVSEEHIEQIINEYETQPEPAPTA